MTMTVMGWLDGDGDDDDDDDDDGDEVKVEPAIVKEEDPSPLKEEATARRKQGGNAK